jgi:hypothetical protein
MVKLIYIANVSLDGFIEDASGSFEWTAPDEEVFALHHRSRALCRHVPLRSATV